MRPGMVLAVEPMVNLGTPRGGRVPRRLDGGDPRREAVRHWEHTIAVTEDGPEVLTPPVIACSPPRTLYSFLAGQPPKALLLLPAEASAAGSATLTFGAPDGSWTGGSAGAKASCEFRQSVQPDSLLPSGWTRRRRRPGATSRSRGRAGRRREGRHRDAQAEPVEVDALKSSEPALREGTKVKNSVRVELKNGGSMPCCSATRSPRAPGRRKLRGQWAADPAAARGDAGGYAPGPALEVDAGLGRSVHRPEAVPLGRSPPPLSSREATRSGSRHSPRASDGGRAYRSGERWTATQDTGQMASTTGRRSLTTSAAPLLNTALPWFPGGPRRREPRSGGAGRKESDFRVVFVGRRKP